MEVILHIEDHAKIVHKVQMIRLSNKEPTVGNLMRKVEELFNVKPDYQQIFYGEEKIHLHTQDMLLSEIGVQNKNTLILNHSMLDVWGAFANGISKIRKSNEKKLNVKKFVDVELSRIDQFHKAQFFQLYPRFEIEKQNFEHDFAHHLDTDKKYMKSAAVLYFLQWHGNRPDNPEFEVKFGEKSNPGAQGGLMCSVWKNGELVTDYHIKSHLGASVRSTDHTKVDLRELFAYKLLMIIKVGPNVHFVGNNHQSKFGLYIATEDVRGFNRACVKTPSPIEKLKLDLLSDILYLTDLHDANYGVNENDNLCIVDFQLEHNYAKKAFNAKNIKTIEEDIKQWDLQASSKEAREAIDVQKRHISERSIVRSVTGDYEDYLNHIEKNIEQVLKICEEVPAKKAKT